MSWVRVWIHLVFATKYRRPTLHNGIRKLIFQHINENALSKDIYIDCVNGYTDHVHCLISLSRELSISKTAQLIKGESSHWINQNKLTINTWQDDYWAEGIGDRGVSAIRSYIHNQEQHHTKTTFQEELTDFIKEYGWQDDVPFDEANGNC